MGFFTFWWGLFCARATGPPRRDAEDAEARRRELGRWGAEDSESCRLSAVGCQLRRWPHSVQVSLAPIGYAHAGHRPRLMRMRRRRKAGAANRAHKIAA